MQQGTEAMLPTIDDTIKDVIRAFLLLRTDDSATFAAEMLRDSAQQLMELANIVIREECASFAGIQEEIRYIQQFDEDSQKIKKLKLNMRLAQFGLFFDWDNQCILFHENEEKERNEQRIISAFHGDKWLQIDSLEHLTGLSKENIQIAVDSLVGKGTLEKTKTRLLRGEIDFYHFPDTPFPEKISGKGKIVLKRDNPN